MWLAGAAVLPILLLGYSVLASLLAHATDVLLLFAALPVTATGIVVLRNLVGAASRRGNGAEMRGARALTAIARR